MGTRVSAAPGDGVSPLSARPIPELLEQFEATGDQAPFEEIVRRYAGMVYNVCYQVSRDAHDAEDATQAVFLTLAVRSKTAQKIQYLGPWLQRVAQRLSLDMKRSKKRRGARELKHHDLNVSRWEQNCQPVDLGMDELRGILRDEIDQLPAKYRMPLILHYFGGLKPDEMSKELGIKANTLGVRLHRARKMLGESLQKRGIVVGGAMLSAALATLIPLYIQHTLASSAHAATAQHLLGGQLVANEVAARVLGTLRAANRAAMLGKIKAVTAAVAIGVAAVAGGKEIVRQIKTHGLEFRRTFDLERWLTPLFDRLRSPLRLSDSGERLERALAVAVSDSTKITVSSVPNFFQLPQQELVFADPLDSEFALASPPGGLTPDSLMLERTPIAIPIPQDRQFRPLESARVVTTPPQARETMGWSATIANAPAPHATRVAAALPVTIRPPADNANTAFLASRGAYQHSNGVIELPSITLDGATAALRSFHVAGGEVRAPSLTIGDSGTAELIHSGGLVKADQLAIGVQQTGSGVYQLSGNAQLEADVQRVGIAGQGTIDQNGGSNIASQIALGETASGVGEYNLRSGQLFTNDLRVGIEGRGRYAQSGGTAIVRALRPDGGITVAERPSSQGTVSISGGELQANNVFVAVAGDGQYNIYGGRTVTSKIILGGTESAEATLTAMSGEIVFDSAGGAPGGSSGLNLGRSASAAWTVAAASSVPNVFAIGVNGDAVVQLGSRTRSVTLREGSPDSATPLLVGATPGSDAVVRGWGDVELRGPLIHNGKFIADGMGQARVLDLSSVAGVQNTIDNDVDGDKGLYAQRKGSLALPPMNVRTSGDYNWGESPNDPVPDLVNSVRVGFNNVTDPGQARLTLLSPDLAAGRIATPVNELFVGLWRFDRSSLKADSTDLLIRYDEHLVRNIGLAESALSLWTFEGEWQKFSASELILDADRNLIGGTVDGRFEYFAVSLSSLHNGGGFSFLDGRLSIPGLADSSAPGRAAAFINDVNLVLPASSTTSSGVPEPAATAIVAAATTMLLRRRR